MWEALQMAICDHFDRDQYPLHMKQLENLKQIGLVADYQARFDQLTHSILLYNLSYDDVYFVTRFLGGLKEEIRASITLHHPPNLEIAAMLALIQEAELEATRSKYHLKSEHREYSKFSTKSFNSSNKIKHPTRNENARKDRTPMDSSWAALKAQHKANVLCFVCGEKWIGR
jgi:hypothetical protein